MKKSNVYQQIKELTPILNAFNLRANRLKELKKAREIQLHIDSKVSNIISISGI